MKKCVILAAVAGVAASALGANFGQGNLVVVRLGTGNTLNNAAQAVFLDEYTTAGVFVQSIAMPTSVSGLDRRLTMSGTANSEGELTRSADGNFLILAGYDADVGTANVVNTTSATVNRVVARVSVTGVPDTSTAISDAFSANNVRGAASVDGSQFWLTGANGGIRYTTYQGASTAQINTVNNPGGLTPITNSRCVNIFGGQLYVSAAQASGRTGVFTIDTGLPTSAGASNSILPGTGGITGQSPYDFVLSGNTLYVADDSAVAGVGGLQKFIFDGSNWSRTDTFTAGLPASARLRQLTSMTDALGQTVVYATTSYSNPAGGPDITAIVCLTDIGAGSSFTEIATGPAGTIFRGIELTPIPAPGALGLLGLAGLAAARRRR